METYLPFRQVFMSRIVRWHPGPSAIMAPMAAVPPTRIWVSMDLYHQISQTHQDSTTGTRLHGIDKLVMSITGHSLQIINIMSFSKIFTHQSSHPSPIYESSNGNIKCIEIPLLRAQHLGGH